MPHLVRTHAKIHLAKRGNAARLATLGDPNGCGSAQPFDVRLQLLAELNSRRGLGMVATVDELTRVASPYDKGSVGDFKTPLCEQTAYEACDVECGDGGELGVMVELEGHQNENGLEPFGIDYTE